MSKEQLLETLLKDAMKHLNETLDKALNLEKQLNIAVDALESIYAYNCTACEDNVKVVHEALTKINEMKNK